MIARANAIEGARDEEVSFRRFEERFSLRAVLPWDERFRTYAVEENGRLRILAVLGAPRTEEKTTESIGLALELLSHPNLVSVTDTGTQDGTVYVEMEWVAARPLSTVLAVEAVDASRRAKILADVRSALAAAHARGIAHGQLEATNVLLVSRGGVERALVFGLGFRALLGHETNAEEDWRALARLFDAPAFSDAALDDHELAPLDFAVDPPVLPVHVAPPGGRADPPPHEVDRRDSWLAPRRSPIPVVSAVVLALGALVSGLLLATQEPPTSEVEAREAIARPTAARTPRSTTKRTDPLTGEALPEPLAALLARIEADEVLERSDLSEAYRYVRAHPEDGRGQLVLGHAYARLHWFTSAIERYRRALHVDATLREDPRLLTRLLSIVESTDLDARVIPLVLSYFDEEAVEFVDARISETPSAKGKRDLEALRDRLRASGE